MENLLTAFKFTFVSTFFMISFPLFGGGKLHEFQSPYFLTRGGAGVSIATDRDAIFYNPAGIAYGRGVYRNITIASPAVMASTGANALYNEIGLKEKDSILTAIKEKGKPQYVSVQNFSGFILRRVAIGAFAKRSCTATMLKDPNDGAMDLIDAHCYEDAVGTFTLSNRLFSKNLYIGTTMKYLDRKYFELRTVASEAERLKQASQDVNRGAGFGYDVGLMYKNPKSPYSFGLTMKNVGGLEVKSSSLSAKYKEIMSNKSTVNVGLGMETGTRMSKFRFLLDYRDATSSYSENPYKKVHFGGELTVKDAVGFTFGLNQGYLTGGFYIDARVFRFDIGSYGEEVGDYINTRPDQRIVVEISVRT